MKMLLKLFNKMLLLNLLNLVVVQTLMLFNITMMN